jgi:hypothetical protein
MTDNETFLAAKVAFLAQQLSSAIDALCEANGNTAVYKAQLDAANARITELESTKEKLDGNAHDHND